MKFNPDSIKTPCFYLYLYIVTNSMKIPQIFTKCASERKKHVHKNVICVHKIVNKRELFIRFG